MDMSTLLTTTRAILVGCRTFAGTGIGPPLESGKTPVVCRASGVAPFMGVGVFMAVTVGGSIESPVEVWLRLMANTSNIKPQMTTTSIAGIHPQEIYETLFATGTGFLP